MTASSSKFKFLFFLFFLNPFFTTILSLLQWDRYGKYLLWLFCVWYGATIGITIGGDVERYILHFNEAYLFTGTYFEFLEHEFAREATDLYLPTLNYFSSRLSSNFETMFAIASAIYAYFMIKTIDLVIKHSAPRGLISVLTLLYIFCIIGFWYLQYIRFMTGVIIIQYVIIGKILFKRNNYFLILLAPVIHFATIGMVGYYYAISFIRLKNIYFWYLIYWLTTYYIKIDLSLLSDVDLGRENALTKNISSKQDYYLPANSETADDGMKVASEPKQSIGPAINWYIRLKNIGYQYLFEILIFFSIFFTKTKDNLREVLVYFLMWKSFGNLFSNMFQGSRMLKPALILEGLFAHMIIVDVDFQKSRFSKFFNPLFLLQTVFFLVVTSRIAFGTMSVNTVYGGPLVAFFYRIRETAEIPIKTALGY